MATDGTVYAWGRDSEGELGDGNSSNRDVPIKVQDGAYSGTTYLGDDSSNKITAVAAGFHHCIALATDGTIYAWGSNDEGQLGENSTTDRSTPVKVLEGAYSGTTYLGDNSSDKITAVAAGYSHSAALATDGTVYAWGRNDEGQLGNSSTDDSTIPVKVTGVGGSGYLDLVDV
ncbi:uncharacterized protein METZ01_LOCUS214705, partial [marine metagenome]